MGIVSGYHFCKVLLLCCLFCCFPLLMQSSALPLGLFDHADMHQNNASSTCTSPETAYAKVSVENLMPLQGVAPPTRNEETSPPPPP